MAHFAKINDDNEVLTVLAVDNSDANTEAKGQTYLETHNNWPADKWIQCSYNTRANVHLLGGTPFRANYPGIGDKWDSTNLIFHKTQPYASWTLNTTTGLWEAPIPMPNTTYTDSTGTVLSDFYAWNEDNQEWIKNTIIF
tara:strand:- start:3512 stop:3931 length:420 start_codon:yes stop_codon:yes gene_type:complete